MALKQENRFLHLKTALGDDTLVLTSIQGREEISGLFNFSLEMLSDKPDIAAKTIVGTNVTFSVRRTDGSFRHFNGFVSRFSAAEERDGRRTYRAEVVPWLWFLTRTADCRIFQNKTLPEVIAEVFKDFGFSDVDDKQIKWQHPSWEYCVQYRETAFNFVSRLMEEEGIFYFFKHEEGKHTLVLADQAGAYKDCPEKEVDLPTDFGSAAIDDHLTSWEHHYEFRSGKWAQTDYNFETPSTSLLTNTDIQGGVEMPGAKKYEMFDYPGSYDKTPDGKTLTDLRMQEEEATHDIVRAAGLCKTFTPGGKFKIKQHPSKSEQKKGFVITSIFHTANEPFAYESGADVPFEYRNAFTCIPDAVVFRPARITPKPVVQGVQTAVVTGPKGEEIFTDQYGRVKVQFHWDRKGKKDDTSSCWMRVAQNWAGKNWGIIFNPRIGQEVIVDFLEGDPDCPIITGRVYNAEQMPPYELPANQTQSGIKSRSSLKGTPDNFNEIRFEDKKGEEQVFIHAEKNQDIEVENDETHWVGHDRTKTIDNDETNHIKRDRTETVDRNEKITIGENRTEKVGKDETINIGQNRKETVGKDEGVNIGGNRSKEVGKDESITIKGDRSESVGKSATWDIAGAAVITVDKTYTTTVTGNITVEGKKDIVIKTGGATVTMKKNGDIEIKCNKLNVNASGDVKIKGSKIAMN